MNKKLFNRLLASCLSASMIVSLIPQSIFAYDAHDEALIEELKSYSEQYPDGAFAFYNSQLEVSEGNGTQYIDIVRMGNAEGEAAVTFKAIDISAVYGEDYTLSVDEGLFISRELEQDPEAKPFMELIAETSEDATIGEKQAQQAEPENSVKIGVSSEDGIVGVNGTFDDTDNDADNDTSIDGEDVISEEVTGLRAAWSDATGKKSSRKSWQDINGTDNKEAASLAQEISESNGYIDEFAHGMPGAEYVLKFGDGEYVKRIKIELIKDNISETDEQAVFVLTDALGAEMAKPNTAYINIKDSDENEPVIFSLPDSEVSVYPEDEYAYITVKRISGIHKFASVTIGTGAITAEPDKDYKSGSVELIFPQGVTERTVKVPIYNANRSEDVTFAVAIDTENAFADPQTSSVAVTIMSSEKSETAKETQSAQLMSTAENTDKTADESVAVSDETAELFASTETKNVKVTASSTDSNKNFGSWTNVLTNLDLRNATSITVYYTNSGEYEYTYQVKEKDGCKDKVVDKIGKRYGKEGKIRVGGKETILSSNASSATITGFNKSKNQTLQLAARRTEDGNKGKTISYTINKVSIAYEDIVITVDNSRVEGKNLYTEKVYEAGAESIDKNTGLGYKKGKTILLGEGKIRGNANDKENTSYIAKRYSDSINFFISGVSENEKTTQGIKPIEGTNVYLAGWQVYNASKNAYDSNIISPNSMNLETLYSKYGNKTSFTIRPVIYPYTSMIRFNNNYPNSLAYTNNISNGKEIKVTMLDTLNISGVAINNSGYAVKQFIVNGYFDPTVHKTSGTKRSKYARIIDMISGRKTTSYLDTYENAGSSVTTISNEADTSTVTILPNIEAIYVNMSYTQPKIEVKYNPHSSAPKVYKDKGGVFYWNTNNPDKSVSSEYGKPMTIQPVNYGTLYNINATYEDNAEGGTSKYKTVWQDFTGDEEGNGEGQLSQAEQQPLLKYNLDRAAVTSDVFTYNPKVTNSKIYYYFTERAISRSEGYIDGTVVLRDYPIFGSKKETYTPINNATVTVDGITVSTAYNDKFGGINGTGGDGYFSVSDNSFIAGEMHRVNIVYGELSTAASQNVNVSQKYILDAYDTISVSSASMAKNGQSLAEEELLYNDDANYTFVFNTKSSNSSLIAEKAVLKFYRRDGSYITEKEYASTGDKTGIFECTFNPKTLGLPSGGKITVTFIDNAGTTYFEHDTGAGLTQSLGAISLMTSFSGKAAPALQVIGTVSSAFNFGWDGNLDDTSAAIGSAGNYSITTSDGKKVLNLGLEFATSGDNKENGKKSKEDVKKAADGNDTNAKKDAAKSADSGKNKSKSSLAMGYNLEMSFGMTLTLAVSDDAQHAGEWYFEEFMIVANAAGELSVSRSFVTPIGIPIIVGADIGASGNAIIVVERRLGSAEYYMADLTNNETGSVDIVNAGQSSASDYFYCYGDFRIAPYISLRAGVGVNNFNISLEGTANFEFLFNTKTKNNSGSVDFSCALSIEILVFKTKFNLGSATVSLFSDGASLYDSLDKFNVSDREYLANRGGWNDSDAQLFAVSNLKETELMKGVNPNADIKLTALDNGKYIAVFVDDVPERTKENSLAVYYSIYSDGKWSQPSIIENDGTLDDSPTIGDLGNGKLFVAWSTANQIFGENPNMLDVLNSRNIHGVFVDKATGNLGEVIEVTKNTEKDNYSDEKAAVAYDSQTEKMMIYYTKSEYTSSDGENGVFGDAVYPYNVIAYRAYDVRNNEFVQYHPETEGLFDYQVLVDLAPAVLVNETLDASGYWTETPTFTEYTNSDPLIVESDAIAYNGLSLFAYIIDYDGDKSTTNDRDVFLQIYNFVEDSVTHPIMITSNDIEEKSLKFERIGDAITFLSYISNGEVKLFDVSSNISNDNVTKSAMTENTRKWYYYLDKTAESGFIPEMAAVHSTSNGDYSGEREIVDFDLQSGEDYFYVMFTESSSKLKAGIEAGTEEAALPENNLVETQIYMTRYDIDNQVLTNPVCVTEQEGANYDNVAFAVSDNDGGFIAMATKSMSTTKEYEGNIISSNGSDNSSLYSITFTPDANVTLENPSVSGIKAGSNAAAGIELYNGGLETIKGVKVEISDTDGNAVDISEIFGESFDLVGGERKEITFAVPVAEDANGAGFTVVAKDAEGNVLDTVQYSDTAERSLDVLSFDAEITERGVIEFDAVVKNNADVNSGKKTFKVMAGETELYSIDAESLKPSETSSINAEIEFDYDTIFQSKKNEDGSVGADVVLTATAGNETLTDTVSLFANAEQMARLNAVTDVSFVSDGNVKVKVGKYLDLNPIIKAENYSGKYTDNNEEKIGAQGVTLKYFIDDESVAKVYDSGYIEGVALGTATITALLMPSDSTYDGVNYISDYPTLPNEAIKAYTIDVEVVKGSSGGSGGSSGGGSASSSSKYDAMLVLDNNKSESINLSANSTVADIEIPTKEGYVFDGWYKDKELTEKADSTLKITSNTTLYAKWVEEEAKPEDSKNENPKPQEQKWENPFKDINAEDWFYGNVEYVHTNKLMNGTEDTLFAPNNDLTRAMLVTILYRADGESEIDEKSHFEDIHEDAYYADAVAWAEANGIVKGVSDTEFAPDMQISREQIAAIMYRYAEYKGIKAVTSEDNLHFDDTDEIAEYAVSAMNWCVDSQIINGYEDNTLRAKHNTTRAEAAAVLQRFVEVMKGFEELKEE